MTIATTLQDDFRQAIEAAGLTAPHLTPGRIVRFPGVGKSNGNKSGWAWLSEDGQVGAFGDWSSDLSDTWNAPHDPAMTAAERAARKQRVAEAQQIRHEEEAKAHAKAAREAHTIWNSAADADPSHPYLQRKGIQPHGVGVDRANRLIVPVMIDDHLSSLLFIDADGDKTYLPGGKVKGASFVIGTFDAAVNIILVAEGFATCASLLEATGHPVVCTFGAHNLQLVARQLRAQLPTATILICGDHDIYADGKPNTGFIEATAAAKAIKGTRVMPELDGQKCDFNDLAQAKGLDAVRAVIETALRPQLTAHTPFTCATTPDSFVTRYVEYALTRTDAPPEAHEAMALGLLSALAGPQVVIPIATSPKGWRLVLWLMVIANSTTVRKTTQQNLAKDILVAVLGEACVVEWEGSPQGLIQRLQERDGQVTVFLRDEYAGLLSQMNRGGHLAGLAQVFIRAFDGNPLENIRTRKKHKDTGLLQSDTDRVDNPYLVKLCATTWDAFIQRATPDNILDGLLARFAFVTGTAEWKPPRRMTEAMSAARNRLVQDARRIYERAQRVPTLDLDDDVLDAYGRLEQSWLAKIADSPCPDVVGPSVKRLAETVLRVAGLLALDESPTDPPRITLAQFESAAVIGARWLVSTLRVVESVGSTMFERTCEAVETSIRAHPGISMSALYHRHKRLRKRDFDEYLEALLTQHRIRIEEGLPTGTKGRPPQRFYPDTQEDT